MKRVAPERFRARGIRRKPVGSQAKPGPGWCSEANLIPFVDAISEMVKAFSMEYGLEYSHRNLVWVLHEYQPQSRVPGAKIRRLQIIAYLAGDQPYISIVLGVEEVKDLLTVLVPKRSPAVRFPATSISTAGQFDRRRFELEMANAWQKTATLRVPPKDMVPVAVAHCVR